ncbi:hypothetical protein BY458DRAFT_498214 [Sporodiniella umbellata]|nr:hypothetical protein BY458DRAFT_498214 [Sporodiniella umbellata]
MFKDTTDYNVLTPTRLILDPNTSNEWNFSAASSFYLNEAIQDPKTVMVPPSPTLHTPPKSPIVKGGERKHLLEKNRQAAYRCRQKKKKWVQELEEKSDVYEKANRDLQAQVSQLRDESVYLRNLLLTHSNCECDMVQDYLKRTSAQLSQGNSTLLQNYL